MRIPFVPLALGLLLAGALPARARTTDFTFEPRVDYATSYAPYHLEMVDVNHDGFPDMIACNSGANNVTVRLNLGNGQFAAATEFTCGSSPQWVGVGDLDNDGNVDMVTANHGGATLTTRYGDGTGGFPTRIDVNTAVVTTCVVPVDLDRDGDLDLVAAGGNKLIVHYGDGHRAFGPANTLDAGAGLYTLTSGDFNGDTEPDVAMTDFNAPAIVIAFGQGNGILGGIVANPVVGNPWTVATGDLNQDGALDLVCANNSSSTVSVLLGHGDGTFDAHVEYPCGSYPYGVAIGDLDGDAVPDLVATNDVEQFVSVLRGLGDGTFTAGPRLAVDHGPISVALEDLDRDGARDISVLQVSGRQVSVFMNAIVGTEPTSIELAVAPDTTVYGQPVTLTATVTPADLRGVVEFTDSGVLLGTDTITAGIVNLTVSSLVHRTHPLRARFLGNPTYVGSSSNVVAHRVALAGATLSLGATASPAVEQVGLRFLAGVQAIPPASGTPAGSIQFRVDGVPLGSPAALVGGSTTSDSTNTLAAGAHVLTAEYLPQDTLRFAGTTDSLAFQVVSAGPAIAGVRDVPNDQGGRVHVTWRCNLDSPDYRIVTGYRVWRRVPAPDASARRAASALRVRALRGVDGQALDTFWEAVAELPAARLVNYGYTAATSQDSLEGSNPYTAFFVQALTKDPDEWYDSAPDSGYSVDNLPPFAPGPFVATYGSQGVALHWNPNAEADLVGYRLYRGTSVDFVPGPGNLLFAGADTGYVDAGGDGSRVYKLAAVDVHGNSSRYALVSADQPLSVGATLLDSHATSRSISLRWYTGAGAGYAAGVERRTESSDWAGVGRARQGEAGEVSYQDDTVVPGVRYGYRLVLPAGDVVTYSSAVWLTAEDPRLALTGAWPNPVRAAALRVRFTLPTGAPARLDLLDVSGRRRLSQDVGALGAGPHDVALRDAAGLRPGVYLLRLTQGTQNQTRRIVLL